MRALIFDVDDTLYDQLRPFKLAIEQHLTVSDELVEKLFFLSRKYSDEVFHLSESGQLSLEEMHRYRIQKALADVNISLSSATAEQFQRDYEGYQKEIVVREDVRQSLDYCRNHEFILGVITNGPRYHQ